MGPSGLKKGQNDLKMTHCKNLQMAFLKIPVLSTFLTLVKKNSRSHYMFKKKKKKIKKQNKIKKEKNKKKKENKKE